MAGLVGAGAGVRRPAVAGSFYPADPGNLAATVDRLLAAAAPPAPAGSPPALVVPHAGYAWSGAVAATAYATLRWPVRPPTHPPPQVVLVGPAHFVPLRGIAVPAAVVWRTPLGDVEIDAGLRALAVEAGARIDDRPHEAEHALEVQLPFLVRVAPGLRVLPVAVGEVDPERAAALLGRLADAADLVVVSTDLSHYHDDRTARRLDARTIGAIEARDAGAIGELAACGVHALRGLVELAAQRQWSVRVLDRRTSADAGGDFDRVVGYAAVAFGATAID